MSPVTQYNTKWIISITTGILTIAAFAFTLGTGFAKNNADHGAINTKIQMAEEIQLEETTRSKAIDKKLVDSVSAMQTDIAVLKQQGVERERNDDRVNETLSEIKAKL